VSAYGDESDIAGSEIAPPIHFRIREQTREERMGPSASSPPSGAGLQPILIGERAQRLYVLKPENIDYIQADGNYVKLRAGSAEYISRDAISRLTAVLAANGFVRIERSLLLNVRAISYAQRSGRGTYTFTMACGACLRSGAKYRAQILRVLPLGPKGVSPSTAGG
jgi:two-component system LytT family response regulator